MIYIILNLVVVAGLVYFTQLLDRKVKTDSFEVTAFAISLLFAVAEAVTLVIVLFLYEKMSDILTTQLLRIVFCLDGMMFTCITFGFASLAANTKKFLPKLLQIAICIAVVPLIYTKFSQIQVTMDRGIIIQSEYLFGSDARNFFPWTWVTVYTIIYRYILPMTGLLFMAIKTEEKASQL